MAICAGCATVNPSDDYTRAAGLITEHTAAASAFTPVEDGEIGARVTDLLADGLNVDESVQIALLNNRDLQARFADIGMARADVVQSGLWTNPSLSLGLMLPQGGGRSKLGMSMAQEIADLWRVPARKKLAEQQLDATVMGVVSAAVDLAAQTKARYYSLVALDERITITQRAIDEATNAADLAQRRFNAGEVSVLDVNLSRARLLDLHAKRIGYTRDRATLEADVRHLLGISGSIELPALTDGLPETIAPSVSEPELVPWAADHRADVQQMIASVAAANAKLHAEKRNVVPSLSLSLDAERSDAKAPVSPAFNPIGTLISPGATAADLARDYVANRVEAKQGRDFEKHQQVDWLVGPGLQITVPVFDQNQAQVAKAALLLWQEERRLIDTFETIAQDVRASTAVLRNAAELTALFEEQGLPLAMQTVGTSLRLYEAAEDSVLAVLDAQDTLVRQREANVNAKEDYALALIELQRTVGGMLPNADTPCTDQVDSP